MIRQDGLQGWEFGGRSGLRPVMAFCVFGGKNGFNIFTRFDQEKQFYSAVILKRIMIFDEELKMDSSFHKFENT
jgi:hypothetical protein